MSKKITELPAASAANLTDLFEKVNDPSGTPVSQKVTLSQMQTAFDSGLAGAGSPEGVVTANPGRTYLNTTDEGFWVKKTGTGNTGWINLIEGV